MITRLVLAAVIAGLCSGTALTTAIAAAKQADPINDEYMRQAAPYVKRLKVVSPELVRGGQPKGKGLELLKKAGIKSVICLRDSGGAIAREKQQVESLGMKFFSIPLAHSKAMGRSAIDSFLSIVADSLNQPVFVHCNSGRDRSGAMVAIYRIKRQGWTAAQAQKEMYELGFHDSFEDLAGSALNYGAKAEEIRKADDDD